MRVVGGRLRGRRLAPPPDDATRPTADRVRESLFNVLESRYRPLLAGGRVGDLYAGTGALGIEALSRGAVHATFIERSPAALKVLKSNIASLGLKEQAQVLQGDSVSLLAGLGPFDILFLDPPYGGQDASEILNTIATYHCISPDHLIVLESDVSDQIDFPQQIVIQLEKVYGRTRISFLEVTGAGATETPDSNEDSEL